jgi:predicted AlkP superfamily pyrophosphatase or phosphodiesterase
MDEQDGQDKTSPAQGPNQATRASILSCASCISMLNKSRLFLIMVLLRCASMLNGGLTLISFRRTVFLTLVAAFLHPVAQSAHAQAVERPYVILVSIDGFRFDYAERYKAKNILAVRNQGAAAASMAPSFPSITFPNHISIVTGLYPEHHGIVGNRFFDTVRNAEYDMHRMGADASWYQAGTPLWVLAEQQHVLAGCMFWPTCDGETVHPSYWKKFDGTFPDEKRVKQVIDWLKLPPEQRPHFITLYFGDVDASGHRYGPESLQTAEAVGQVDRMIGKLREELEPLKLPVNLILVSDHGMQAVTDGEVSLAGIDTGKVRVELDGPVAFIYCPDATSIEKTYQHMKKNSRLDVYKRSETPEPWHFNENPRAGDLVAIVRGAAVFTVGLSARRILPPRGDHGYDPQKFPSMQAIFYAIGPNIARETKIASFQNVNVYPFVAKILGLKLPEKLDGSPSVLDPIYRQ